MKPVIIIGIVAVIVVIAAGLMISSDKMSVVEPWSGMDCNEMLDFSGMAEHNLMDDTMHLEFHEHYLDNCSDIKESTNNT